MTNNSCWSAWRAAAFAAAVAAATADGVKIMGRARFKTKVTLGKLVAAAGRTPRPFGFHVTVAGE